MRSYLPANPGGYALDSERSWVSVVVPEATENLILNPSLETNTTSWAGVNVTLARTTTYQFRGAFSLSVTLNAGSRTVTITTATQTNGTRYTFSLHMRRANAGPIANGILMPANSQRTYVGNGWYRYWYQFTSSGGSTIVLPFTAGAIGEVYYLDGVQLEAKPYPTTYCDGDEEGLLPREVPAPFVWTGTPHGSTSQRRATTQAGGKVVPLSDYGVTLVGITGLGMAPVINSSVVLSGDDGSTYETTIRTARTFVLAARMSANPAAQLQRLRAALSRTMLHDRTGYKQPLVLHIQRHEGREPIADTGELTCSYVSGLEGNDASLYGEDVQLQFEMYQPGIRDLSSRGITIPVETAATGIQGIGQRGLDGAWTPMGTGTTSNVFALADAGGDGVIAGGAFTTIGGVSAGRLARWTGSAWQAIASTTANGDVFALAVAPDNRVYAGGAFTLLFGPSANRIAVWDGVIGNAWTPLGTGLTGGDCLAIAIGPDGRVYAGGAFTSAGGGGANRIAVWNGATWAALGSGFDGVCRALAFGPDGRLYAGGSFTTAGGGSANRIAVWNGTTWAALGSGMNATVWSLAFGPDGRLYAGGDMTTAGGTPVAFVAVWNGTRWAAVGSGITGTVFALRFAPDGTLLVGRESAYGNNIRVSIWTGSNYVPIDLYQPAGATTRAILAGRNGRTTFGFEIGATISTSGRATLTYPGTAPAAPTFVMTPTQSAELWGVRNATTNRTVVTRARLNTNERTTLRTDIGRLTFQSPFRSDLTGTILPGSNPDLALIPGANVLSVFLFNAPGSSTAVAHVRPRYNRLDDLTR